MAGSEVRVCRSYTTARRHPKVVGVVGGWALPVPLTLTQLGAGMALGVALWAARGLWARLPGAWNLLVAAWLVGAGMWAVRQVRIGGRPPLWAAVGAVRYLARPRHGWAGGRRCRPARPVVQLPCRLFLEA